MEILIATNNKGKIREIKSYFPESGIKWMVADDFKGYPKTEESGSTFLENAIIKARNLSEFSGKITLADDSGLEVDFLDKKPGVFSSRYAGKNAIDKQNRDKLLSELRGASDVLERSARFVCSIVLWDPEKGLLCDVSGVCKGHIGFNEKGQGGFGYDCIFIPDGYEKTMAELDQEEKNRISHRGKALKALHEFIVNF